MDLNQMRALLMEHRNSDNWRNTPAEVQELVINMLAANKMLSQENNRLQQVVKRLVSRMEFVRNHRENAIAPKVYPTVECPHFDLEASNRQRILLLAERTLREFLLKATGNAVEWVQIPQNGSNLVQHVSILRSCDGAAARACCYVPSKPTEVIEILKDHSSWFSDCRMMDSRILSSNEGGTIELVYMQLYALTILTSARDLSTLRVTATLEDGSLVVCQRSISGSGIGPDFPLMSEFQRAKMLASGFLIQPCTGGSTVIKVDHFDSEEASSFSMALRPLFVSSKLVAQRMTVDALNRIVQQAKQKRDEKTHSLGPYSKQPACVQSFSRTLSRVFNDAINGFVEDNWIMISCDNSENITLSAKPTEKTQNESNISDALTSCGGILCVKATIPMESVSPVVLVRYLKEHHSEWWEFKDDQSDESVNYGALALPGLGMHFLEVEEELRNERNGDEILEVIRIKRQSPHQYRASPPQDLYLLQISNGLGESSIGACSELIFGPLDNRPMDEVPILSSGFRILSLESNTDINGQAQKTMNLASSSVTPPSLSNGSCSLMILAFQFPFERHRLDHVAYMAKNYTGHVISYVRDICSRIEPSRFSSLGMQVLIPGTLAAVSLATDICQTYRLKFGKRLLRISSNGEAVLKHLWLHQDAILCWSFKPVSLCLFANLSACNMLDAPYSQVIKAEEVFDKSFQKEILTVLEKGYVKLGGGTCMSLRGTFMKYEHVHVWIVEEGTSAATRIAFAFTNWSQGIYYGR